MSPSVLKVEVDTFADDALVLGDRRADEIRGQLQDGVIVEFGGEPFLGQFDPVSGDAWEADFKMHRGQGELP